MQKVWSLVVVYFLTNVFTSVLGQHVKVQTWYDNKKLQLKESYYILSPKSSIIDSIYISYYQNQNIKSRGNYLLNKPTGVWEYFYENGNIRSTGEIKDNQPSGIWTYYYENGGISMEGLVLKGQKESEWKFFYENGTMKSAGLYEKGKKEGLWNYFSEDGTLKAQGDYHNDNGTYKELYPSGKIKSEGKIVGGKSNGIWNYYYEDGKTKAAGEEKDGLKTGYWKFYHPNGKVASEGNFVDGKEEGTWKYFHENGNLSAEGDNKEGERDGYWKLYQKNGFTKLAEGDFKQGDGLYKEYYESGKLKVKGNVKKGKNDGEWDYYYESGEPEGKAFYEDGKGKYTGYYKNQNLKMEGRIEDGKKVGIWTLYKEDGSLAGYYKTYYEDEVPVFKPIDEKKDVDSNQASIVHLPSAKFKKRLPRNYIKKVNEYKEYIFSFQPLGPLKKQFPISLEYYIQERLGFELNFTYWRNPFFSIHSSLPKDVEFSSGYSSYLRQKLYKPDKDYGMLYWAQEIRFTSIDHHVSSSDNTGQQQLLVKDRRYEVSILVGDRLLRDSKKKGWTIDMFAGIGLGYRDIKRNYQHDPRKDNLFTSFKNINRNITVPIRMGISLGYLF